MFNAGTTFYTNKLLLPYCTDHFSQFTILYGECSDPGSENVWANRKSKTGHRAISTRPPTGKQSVGVRRRGARSLSHIVTVTIGGVCRLKYAGTKLHKRTPNAVSYHKPWRNQHKEQQWLVSHSGNVGIGIFASQYLNATNITAILTV